VIRPATLIALFAAAPLFAQTKEVVEEVDARQRIAIRHAEERNEDIEVLRRLLNSAFGFDHVTSQLPDPPQGYYVHQTTAVALPVGKRMSQTVGPFDGVYLKGSGVVFTLRVPKEEMQFGHGLCVGSADKQLGLGSSCGKCHADVMAVHQSNAKTACASCHSGTSTVTAPAPLSDWDRVRAAVRGEKPPAVTSSVADAKKPRAVMCKPGDARELIVAQLHAHAKNLRHLDPTDRVTVAVTFDEAPGAKPKFIPTPSDKPGFTPDERQALTLGDLHLKQGKFKEAVAAYEKGLTRYRDGVIRLTFPPTISAAEVSKVIAETQASVRASYKSLAAAYLQTNELDKARAALERAMTLKVELATAGAEKAKPRLPAKLVLSVTKADIDRNPKLEELRKAAVIETTGFPPPAGKQ